MNKPALRGEHTMLKCVVFIIAFCAPFAAYLAIYDLVENELSLRTLVIFIPMTALGAIALSGLDWIDFTGRCEKKTHSELAMRGLLGGIAFLLSAWMLSGFGLRVLVFGTLAFALVLGPIALAIPFERKS